MINDEYFEDLNDGLKSDYKMKRQTTEEMLDEAIEWLKCAARLYCPGCGQGSEGCSTIHWNHCRVDKLIAEYEMRQDKITNNQFRS